MVKDFRVFYERYNRSLYHFFVNRGFTQEESRDLTQETFLQAYKSLGSFRGQAKVTTWLRGVAANTLKRALRDRNRAKRKAKVLSFEALDERTRRHLVEVRRDSSTPGAGLPLQDILAEEQQQLIQTAIEELPERMRACLRLYLDQGLKYREIAVVLRMSEGTVKSHVFEARSRLRERLAAHFEITPMRRSS